MQIPIPKIFNPEGNDLPANRRLVGGNITNLIQLNDVRYDWAISLYRQMRENFWIAERIDITKDVTNYNELTPEERRAFDGILSYLTFLDSIQVANLPNLKLPITAPEIKLCLAEQESQEALHNQSYQYMIETIIPSDRRSEVYDFWRTDSFLKERCETIAKLYQSYADDPTPENYFTALVADYVLEGLYFYNGFIFFYSLASRQLMSGSADIFKLINRDELSHVRLYQKILGLAMEILPHSKDQILEIMHSAVEQEILWSNHILGDQILGITPQSTEQYTKYLANARLGAIGLPRLYEGFTTSPYAHLERFADTKAAANTKANFFEATVTSYVMSSGVDGWDDV
jgi:ribonucleoside-diphosphate reductase beta chain